MGLDMYLTRRIYVQNWDFQKPEAKHIISIKKGGKERTDINKKKIIYIIEQAGYWRKANAIHNWFVENCQGGKDDCEEYHVSSENLEKLRDLCKKVLAGDCIKAHELLPTREGFFFGGKEYDEYYASDLKDTVEFLDEALKNDNDEYYYHSSW